VQTVRDFANERPRMLVEQIKDELGLSDSELREVFGEYAEE
jgi:hypothetical protein